MRLVFALLALLATGAPLWPQSGAPDTPKKIGNFHLKDTTGRPWTLADAKGKAVVVFFLGTQCPINNAYAPRLAELHREYADKGIGFVAINANDQDSPEAIAEHARLHKLPFPVLRDEKHLAADRFGAERTPVAFVLDADFVVRYRGRIDDQFGIGYQRKQPTRRDLAEALDDVLAGKPVRVARTAVAGCLIGRAPAPKAGATVTFSKQVAPLVQQHCQECHRPGQIGPMPLVTYDDVSGWAQMIREVIEERRMPPWYADPKHSKFRNDRSLPADARKTILAWIDQGCPRGDDRELPAPKKFAEGWTIGTPDLVFTMPKAISVPAKAPKNGIPYRYVVIPTNFTEDRWVQAVEAKPGNRAVVHHILVYVAQGKKRLGDSTDGIGNGLLCAQAPGDLALTFAPGHARLVPKGANLVLQMHYTPNGTEQTDRSSVGLIFAKGPVTHQVKTRAIAQQFLLIPPGKADHKAFVAGTFRKDVEITSLFPHMHLRGKSFEYVAVYPDGKREVLLSVPRYDFNWQTNYCFEKPLYLPAGTRIECTAHFDNSAANPNNPDATKLVRWGEQTWDEMLIGFVDYAIVEAKSLDERK